MWKSGNGAATRAPVGANKTRLEECQNENLENFPFYCNMFPHRMRIRIGMITQLSPPSLSPLTRRKLQRFRLSPGERICVAKFQDIFLRLLSSRQMSQEKRQIKKGFKVKSWGGEKGGERKNWKVKRREKWKAWNSAEKRGTDECIDSHLELLWENKERSNTQTKLLILEQKHQCDTAGRNWQLLEIFRSSFREDCLDLSFICICLLLIRHWSNIPRIAYAGPHHSLW